MVSGERLAAGSGGLVSLDLGEALTGFVVVREMLQQQVHGEQSSPERMEDGRVVYAGEEGRQGFI